MNSTEPNYPRMTIGGILLLSQAHYEAAHDRWKFIIPFEVNDIIVEINVYYREGEKKWETSPVYVAEEDSEAWEKHFPSMTPSAVDHIIKEALLEDERVRQWMNEKETELLYPGK